MSEFCAKPALFLLRFSCISVLCFFLLSCETVRYYGQAVNGQFSIFRHRSNIEQLLAGDEASSSLKKQLKLVLSIRKFAEEELALPVGNNYSTYVDLKRPYVVWNVFATPEFSMSGVNWCYPIAGCVSYRGYFKEQSAQKFASNLRSQGRYDVYVGGISAYSTLGWFSDSILNTIIDRADYELASLLFHELAHQVLYIPGDTQFNESFATAVEREGLKRWVVKQEELRGQSAEFDAELESSHRAEDILAQAEVARSRQEDFVALVTLTASKLKRLYSTELPEAEKRAKKATEITALRQGYQSLKISWNGYAGYDAWFARDLNNAQLSTVTTYFTWVPAFAKILEENSGNLEDFYEQVAALQSLKESERINLLNAYLD